MDQIVSAALVGITRPEQGNLATGSLIDALIAELPEGEAARKFLLGAGAWAVYCQAGRLPRQIAVLPEPAAAEKSRACSTGVSLLISRLLAGEQAELLPEA